MKNFKFALLRCPKCHSKLSLQDEGAFSKLHCPSCDKTYPVTDGIPRFVESDSYADNFSFMEKMYKKLRVGAKGLYAPKYFFLRFGLPPDFFKGKRTLDAGIGPGRYAKVALNAGAEVWGIDLSYSVDIARDYLINYKDICIAQSNIFELPFEEESFDVIYCFDVLHHTPDPEKAFGNLVGYLKPGGLICISVYPNVGIYHSSRYLRKLTTRLPKKLLFLITTLMTLFFYLPYRYLGLRYGILGRFAPIALLDHLGESIFNTYDCYAPKYQFTYSYYDVFQWFEKNGLKNIKVRPQPVTMLGYK